VEPVSLTVGAVVAALVAKASDRAVDATVEGGEGVLRGLVARLRRRFGDARDDGAAEALALVERVPDSASLVGALASAVDRHVAADPGFGAELDDLVRRVREAGVRVGDVSQSAIGEQIVQNAGVTDSQINVTYGRAPQTPRE
jgi:hypothetical protein